MKIKRIIVMISFFLLAAAELKAETVLKNVAQVHVEKAEGKVKWRRGIGFWKDISSGVMLDEKSEIKTGNKGNLTLQLAEGSRVEVKPGTEIKLESLHDPSNQPLIWIVLKTGEISARIAPFDSYRAFSINTEPAMLIVDQGTPVFSVKQDSESGLTTVAVEEGMMMIQTENPEIQPINLGAGEQVSLNKNRMGPIVAVGAPPGLGEPESLKHKLLDLGQLQVCENAEGQHFDKLSAVPSKVEGQKEICGDWSWKRQAQAFDATWQNGAAGILKVEKMGDGEIILTRKDLSGPTAGLTARYTGRSPGVEPQGDVIFQILEGTVEWEHQGASSAGTWRARSSYLLDLGSSEK